MEKRGMATFSYETRTPITNIIGFAELIEKAGELNPKQREFLGDLQASAKTLLAIVDDVLALASRGDPEDGPTLH
jgi:signal transduction histidine kinase